MQDAIWIAIELRREDLERQAHAVYTRTGFAALWTCQTARITTRGRKRPGKERIAKEALIETWILPGYLILAHDGGDEFWHRVLNLKWPRGGVIAAQPVRIAGSDHVPASAVRDLIDRCGEVVMPAELPVYRPGQRVRILEDVFAGYEGRIGDVSGDDVWIETPVGRIRARADQLEAA